MASPETGSEKHRDVAREVVLTVWLEEYGDDASGPDSDTLTAPWIAEIAAALARVEAETRREFDDERAALRAVLTPLRELAAKATPPPWTPPADLKGGENAVPVSTSGTGMIVKAYGRPHSTNDGTRVIKFQEMRGNAELICALRNALPALLNALAPEPVAGDAPPKHEPSS